MSRTRASTASPARRSCKPSRQAGPNTLRFAQKKDFNPRFGFAYRPFNDTKTVIRGGVGRYTMTILGAVFYSLTGISSSDVREFTNNIQNGKPLFQLPQISTSGSGVTSAAYGNAYFGTANDPNFKDPYSDSVEPQRGARPRLEYRLARLLHRPALRAVALGAGTEPAATLHHRRTRSARSPTARSPTGAASIRAIPEPTRSTTRCRPKLTHRMRSGLTLNSAWTWAKDLSDANGPTSSGFSGETGGGRVTNSLCRRCDRGNVGAVRRHRSITTAVYELPFGKGRHFGSALESGCSMRSAAAGTSAAFSCCKPDRT